MKNLIIVTGISGSGKTTLAKQISYEKNAILISLDTIKEDLWDRTGFHNLEEKEMIAEDAKTKFLIMLDEMMQHCVETIVIEYPFRKEWKKIFCFLSQKYKYNVTTINCIPNDINQAYKNLEIRCSEGKRHPAHCLESYNPQNIYHPFNEIKWNNYVNELELKIYTSLNIGIVKEYQYELNNLYF